VDGRSGLTYVPRRLYFLDPGSLSRFGPLPRCRKNNGSNDKECPMLVVHWTPHNRTSRILANRIRPSRRHFGSGSLHGVWVYPFSQIKTLRATWRRNLKRWDHRLGHFNGFVFRLTPADFPLLVGKWYLNRSNPAAATCTSPDVLTRLWRDVLSGVASLPDCEAPDHEHFEIVLLERVEPNRIRRILTDGQTGHERHAGGARSRRGSARGGIFVNDRETE
jgi:hypothetical protein